MAATAPASRAAVFKNLGKCGDGLGRIAQPIARDFRHAHEIGATLDPRHLGARPLGQGLDQLLPPLGAIENLDGPGQRLAIAGIGGKPLPPQAERAIELAARAGQFGGLTQEPAAHAGGGFQLGLAFEDVEALVRVGSEQGTELAQGQEYLFGLRGTAGQGLVEKRDGLLGAGSSFAPLLDLGGLQPQRDLQLGVLGGLGRDQKSAHVGRRRRGQLGQELEPRPRRGLLGLERDQLDQPFARRREIALALEQVGGFVDQGPRLVGRREGQGHAQGRHHAVQPAHLPVSRAQDGEGAPAYGPVQARVRQNALGQGARNPIVGERGLRQHLVHLVESLVRLAQVVEVKPGQALAHVDSVVTRHHG